ncbi:hypothetical protein [Promicromonospora soli]|uniref:DUF3137 domain-containing protein n=1 Tax=Promicromonospora soli TaxID=2035533 RepID=A0A919G4T1_9MICO|nr:hypothetical protein [Promicromonospora soli]GHH78050.1 hypothetical protein GCM10017772_40660 [Promicromonospora soli]
MVDYAPLRATPTATDSAAVLEAARRGDFGPETARHVGGAGRASTAIGWLVGGFLTLLVLIAIVVQLVEGDPDALVVGGFFIAGTVLLGVLVKVLVALSERRSVGRLVRLVTFARANDLPVEPEAQVRLLPGSIFVSLPHARTMHRVQWPAGGLSFELATHTRWQGQGTIQVRFLAAQLDVEPPRLTFHHGRTGGVRPADILGTDAFKDEKYALVARTHDHAGARAFMTDELVALLTDRGRPVSVEVADGWFLAYFKHYDELDERAWQQAFSVAEAVVRARDAYRAWEESRPSGK